MDNRLKQCAESLKDVEKILQSLADTSSDSVDLGRISEALSFVGEAIAALSHPRENAALRESETD